MEHGRGRIELRNPGWSRHPRSRQNACRVLLAAQALLLLLPATLAFGFVAFLSYPAYPPSQMSMPQMAFDLGMLLMLAGMAAAWRLATRYLWAGRAGLRRAHRAWLGALVLAALVGACGAGVAVVHLLDPAEPATWVGFALLAPGALLIPLAVQLALEARR